MVTSQNVLLRHKSTKHANNNVQKLNRKIGKIREIYAKELLCISFLLQNRNLKKFIVHNRSRILLVPGANDTSNYAFDKT